MKTTLKRTFDYSPIALRGLTRHAMPPPTTYFKDRKQASNKSACRGKVTDQ